MTLAFHVVTGPSGAGKSTFCRQQIDFEHRLYNLDDWARLRGNVNDPVVREMAWQEIVRGLRTEMKVGTSPLALDHILDARAVEEVIVPAKERGYTLHLTVVCPASPDVCVERVASREREGGHGRSPATIRQLFGDALTVAAEASLLCDQTVLVDSSGHELRVVATIEGFRLKYAAKDRPHWVEAYFGASESPRAR